MFFARCGTLWFVARKLGANGLSFPTTACSLNSAATMPGRFIVKATAWRTSLFLNGPVSQRIDSSRCVAALMLITLKFPVSSCGLTATENWSIASIEPAWRADAMVDSSA